MRQPLAALLVLVLGLAGPARAGLAPSFEAESCGWRATHVVVVSEGAAIDGVVRVVESWRGDLNVGDELTLPALARFAPKEARTTWGGWDERPVEVVSGARMVVFLVRADGGWKHAAPWGGLDVSTVWVERGACWGLVQVVNPGAPVLVNVGAEDELKALIGQLGRLRGDLDAALALPDPSARAEALVPFTRDGVTSGDAYEALATRCGAASVPILERLVSVDQGDPYSATRALVRAGGAATGPFLLERLQAELGPWRDLARTLPATWWNEGEHEPLRRRYSRLHTFVEAVARVRPPGCDRLLRELRDLWRSSAGLSSVSQIIEMCERALEGVDRDGLLAELRALGEPAPPNDGPYEAETAPFTAIREAALRTGDALALARVADALVAGDGVGRDLRAAARWLTRAAEAGHVPSMRELSWWLHYGSGLKEDQAASGRWRARALEVSREAAATGDVAAVASLAGLLLGEREGGHEAEVDRLLEQAAKGEDAWALRAWASRLRARGQEEEARRCEARAAERTRALAAAGDPAAMWALGEELLPTRDSTGPDAARGMAWLRKAAEAGQTDAMYSLSWRETGAARVRWLRRLAELGSPIALYDLAKRYQEGDGVPKSDEEAVRWYRAALETRVGPSTHEFVELLRRRKDLRRPGDARVIEEALRPTYVTPDGW